MLLPNACSAFIKKEALKRIQQNIDVKLETKNLQADIKDLKRILEIRLLQV